MRKYISEQYPQDAPLPNGTHASLISLSKELSSNTPPLPLSPISNPSSPPRKRQRTSKWRPPSHIPDFLPAFPTDTSSVEQPISPQSPRMPPSQLPPLKIERPPSPLPQPSTPTYASDYFTSVPYDQSSLSSMPEWHLPTSRPPRVSHPHLIRLPTPQTQPTLITAYHHILTRPPPPTTSAANPSRHKVAMALLSLTQSSPRWETPNTLYSSSAPCAPRLAVIGPTFPILIGETPPGPGDQKAADAERERKANLPSLPPRAVFSNENITPLVTQQPSRIPELARHVLPVRSVTLPYCFYTHTPPYQGSVYNRTTRLNHPPPLFRESRGGQDSQRLVYGSGVNAPWNTNAGLPTIASTPTTAKLRDDSVPNGLPNGKDSLTRTIPDARLHGTWDYEAKRYNEVLLVGRRGRMNSMSGLTLSIGGRAQGESKVG
jgi:hypothetical protein